MTTPPGFYSASLTRIIIEATIEIVLDMSLDYLYGLSVHYIKHMWPRKKNSMKSEKERELEWRREIRLHRKERLTKAEAETKSE